MPGSHRMQKLCGTEAGSIPCPSLTYGVVLTMAGLRHAAILLTSGQFFVRALSDLHQSCLEVMPGHT